MYTIYAIYDTIAQSLVGGLLLFKSAPPAIRYFADLASDPKTMIHRHVEHYDLIDLGTLTDDTELRLHGREREIVITGKAWLAAQQNAEQLQLVKDA